MARTFTLTMDASDPAALAEFWKQALGYELESPPEGFATWPEALKSWGIPESEWNSASAIVDPDVTSHHRKGMIKKAMT